MKKMVYAKGGQVGWKVAVSLLVSNCILLLGIVGLTSIVLSGKMEEHMIGTASTVLLFSSCVMGAVIAAAGENKFWIAVCAYTAIQYLLLILMNVVFFQGGLERLGVGTLAVVIGVIVAIGLKFIPIGKPRNRKYKQRFR
jgi:hypothetical protein